MKHNKLLSLGCIALGLAMLLATILLAVGNRREDQAAAAASQRALTILETRAAPTAPPENLPATDPTDPPTLSSEILDGHEYVGYLSFPSLERKLPVIKIAYLEDLTIAPCLEVGSPWTDDAVISAHNYPSHFGPIRDWKGGEEVVFTSLEGREIHYTVALVETIAPDNVAAVMDSDYDLVLYTCTPGGSKRVMVACNRSE